ncbi:MAG: hypothetical protein OXU20_15085 [Myxococcales bacterium]|nr:hypothetical protein [Myxococcales bacterium]
MTAGRLLAWVFTTALTWAVLANRSPPGAAAEPTVRDRLWLAVDDDDDDGDGRPDRQQAEAVPVDDLVEVPAALVAHAIGVGVVGDNARLVQDGVPTAREWQANTPGGPLRLQGLELGTAKLRVRNADGHHDIPVQVVRLGLLDARNQPIDPTRSALQISRRVTNDRSLPDGAGHDLESPDKRNFRVELVAPKRAGRDQTVHVVATRSDGVKRAKLVARMRRATPRAAFRSRFLRLVADRIDRDAPGVKSQVLHAGLHDRIRIAWQSPSGWLSQDISMGTPASAKTRRPHKRRSDWQAILEGRLHVLILRTYAGGPPVIGRDDMSAVLIAREQIRTANEVWAQCGITFGPAAETMITVVAPPPPSLISVGDGDGLPARGDGTIQLQINGVVVGPLSTIAGARPLDTALTLAEAIRKAGFSVRVTRNPSAQFGVHPSADLLVRSRSGDLATVAHALGQPLSTDGRQRVRLGVVDLGDGLQEFNNMNARAGSLEERALVKSLADDDPTTIDLFIINHFSQGTRQGEAFIEASGGSVVNTVILDRNGLRQRDTAWTLAHEVGHVLLDEPLHPDNLGPDRPWLLMDSDSNRGTVYGPKRITSDECTKARYESGPEASPSLLTMAP